MAIAALSTGGAGSMVMVIGIAIVAGLQAASIQTGADGLTLGVVALGANRVSGSTQLAAVRVVAIAALHPGLLHSALHEGSVLEHFIQNFAVHLIKIRA